MAALRHTNLIAAASSDVILEDGVTAAVETRLLSDCADFVFCRLIKTAEVPSHLNFTGLVLGEDTKLTSSLDDFALNEAVSQQNNTLVIKVAEKDGACYSYLKLKGDLVTAVDPDTDLQFDSLWRFAGQPDEPISLTGRKHGVYFDVFEVPVVDLVQNEVVGRIGVDGQLSEFRFTALGVLGTDCYKHEDLLKTIDESEHEPDVTIYEYNVNEAEIDEDGSVAVIKNKCKVGATEFQIFDRLNKNSYSSKYFFENFEDYMKAIFKVQSEDTFNVLINSVAFPYGLDHTYHYEQARNKKPLPFVGKMDYLGLNTFGEIWADLEQNKADLKIFLPSYSIGGGNLQFLTYSDFRAYYDVYDKNCRKGKFDTQLDCGDFRNPNTITSSFDPNSLADAVFTIDTNAVLFEILFRYTAPLDGKGMDISVHGKPFRGSFEAFINVTAPFTTIMQNEVYSTVSVELDKTDNFEELQKDVNQELQKWITSIIVFDSRISGREARLQGEKDYLTSKVGSDCEVEEF